MVVVAGVVKLNWLLKESVERSRERLNWFKKRHQLKRVNLNFSKVKRNETAPRSASNLNTAIDDQRNFR
jgi:hypothetical protein